MALANAGASFVHSTLEVEHSLKGLVETSTQSALYPDNTAEGGLNAGNRSHQCDIEEPGKYA